jgi:hypothetical protein
MTLRLPVLTTLAACLLPVAAMAQPAADVRLPPIEVGVSVSFDKLRNDGPAGKLGGFGEALTVARDFGQQLALAGEITSSSVRDDPGTRAIAFAAGPRIGTGFVRDSDSVGRFYAQFLAGVQRQRDRIVPTAFAGAGADVLLDETRGIGLHWSLEYRMVPTREPNLSGVRIAIGLMFGPHVRRRP